MRQPATWCGLACVLVLALSAAARGQAMDPVAARQWHENAVKKITDKSTADEIFALAKQCYRNGLTDEAMAHAIEALRKDPNDSRAKYLLFALAPPPPRPTTPAEAGVIRPGKWVELLPLVDLGRDVVEGQWQVTPQGIRSDAGESSHVAVPVVTSHSYELAFRFTRPDPKKGLVLATFPVGGRSVTLVLGGWGNAKSGLGQVHGRRYLDNETTVDPGGLEGGHLYTVDIRVVPEGDQVAIAVALDGKPFTKWKGPQSELGPDPGVALPHPQCLGLGAGHAYVTFHSMRLRMLSGKARLLRPATAAAGAGETLPGGKWAELLPHVDPAKDTLAGMCTMEGGRLVLGPSQEAKLMLPVATAGSYELEVRFARVTGNDSLVLMLPVGSRLVGLFVSALGGQSHDLGKVRGGGPYDKIAVSPGTLENNKPHTVSARVLVRGDQASIETRLDGASLVKWQGPWSDLSPWPDWQLPDSGALGLGAAQGRYVVASVRLRMLSGEARLLRPPG